MMKPTKNFPVRKEPAHGAFAADTRNRTICVKKFL